MQKCLKSGKLEVFSTLFPSLSLKLYFQIFYSDDALANYTCQVMKTTLQIFRKSRVFTFILTKSINLGQDFKLR